MPRFSLALVLTLLTAGAPLAHAQANASALIKQVVKAFSTGPTVSSVELDGTVVWYSGASSDSGPITITVGSDGSQSFMAHLASTGDRSETQSGVGAGMSCGWSRSGGASHPNDMMSCQKPVPWALPVLALQDTKIPKEAGYTDIGTEVVNGISYRHLQGQLVFADLPAKLLPQSVAASTVDVDVDSQNFDLASLRYQVHPDDHPELSVQMEIRYAQVKVVNGVRIPFLIQRYVNGTLQLEIAINSAQIS